MYAGRANNGELQRGAFVAVCALLVVWNDEPQNLLNRAERIEEQTRRIVRGMDDSGEDEFGEIMYNKEAVTVADET